MPSINMSAAAAAAGVTASYLSRVLGGTQSPGLETAGRIAKALGVGVEEVAALRVKARKVGRGRARNKVA
jgi:transcriptional regulator with XRE-family HTH domain